jgi:hypothetical protein
MFWQPYFTDTNRMAAALPDPLNELDRHMRD